MGLYSDLQVTDEEVPQLTDYACGNQVVAEQWRNLFRVITSLSVCLDFLLCLQNQHKIEAMTFCHIHDYSIKACITFMASFQSSDLK